MHEVSLVRSMLDIVEEYAAKCGFSRVNSIRLSLGRLSCIEPKTLEFAFQVESQETKAAGAKLNFEILPVRIHCLGCESDTEAASYPGSCPACGAAEIMVTGGKEELKIIDMEVD